MRCTLYHKIERLYSIHPGGFHVLGVYRGLKLQGFRVQQPPFHGGMAVGGSV